MSARHATAPRVQRFGSLLNVDRLSTTRCARMPYKPRSPRVAPPVPSPRRLREASVHSFPVVRRFESGIRAAGKRRESRSRPWECRLGCRFRRTENTVGIARRPDSQSRTSGPRRVKPTGAVRSLLDRWQTEAETLRRRGAPAQADALEACCRELEAALHEHELESLTITQAAAESGYSESQLRRIFKGRSTVSRGALPRKPKHGEAA